MGSFGLCCLKALVLENSPLAIHPSLSMSFQSPHSCFLWYEVCAVLKVKVVEVSDPMQFMEELRRFQFDGARAATLPLQGAPRPLAWQPVHRTGSSTICLLFQPKPLAVALLSTPSPRLRTTARLSPRVRVRPPASPDPPPSAHGLPRGSPAPDASTRAQPASASKPKTKKARRRKARPPGGQATEDLEAHALAWIAEAEADAEAQILEAASDGEEWA